MINLFISTLHNPHVLLSIAALSEVIGGVLIAFVVYSVHQHIAKERKIDEDVLKSMRAEKIYMAVGICLMIFSFVIEIWTRLVLGIALV